MSLQIAGSKYVKVFDPEDKGKYVEANLSTSKKDKDGNRVWMNWFGARFVGKAKGKADGLNNKDTIEINSGLIENVYDKEKKKTYINIVVFDFDVMESKPKGDEPDLDEFQAIDDDETLPF